jgi:hypothetical protein
MPPPPPNVPVSEGTVGLTPSPGRPLSTAAVSINIYGVISGPGVFITDTWPWRVPRGESCVEAAEHRGTIVANSLASSGVIPPGYTARVGAVSGYDAGFGSLHTYNVVEIKDQGGRIVKTIEFDNYLGVPVINPFHGNVNWNDPYTHEIRTIRK